MTIAFRSRSAQLLPSAALLGALLALPALGCDDEERAVATSGPNGTAGATNSAGAAGRGSGGLSSGGSAGASAGGSAASGAAGVSGTAGAAGGGSGKGGSGGTAGTTGGASGKGGSAGVGGGAASGGAGGSSAKAGAGGSAGKAGGSALPPIGSACTEDKACGAGNKCLLPSGTDFLGGGPTHGLCVKDCAPTGSSCPTGATCVAFDGDKYCVESCTYGTPPLPDDPTVDLPEDKCHGRLDLACAPLGGTTNGACVPRCWPSQSGVDAADLCPTGTTCDPTKGACVATDVPVGLQGLLRNGASCAPKAATRQCLGNCISLDTNDATGICSEPCSGAVAESCGGLDAGLCFLDTEGVTGANNAFVYFGPLDVAGCAASVGPTDDASCLWQSGWFPVSFAFPDKTRAYCLPAKACSGDTDCVETCKQKKDCSHSDAVCTNGTCTVSDTCNAVGSEKYCMDHAPTVP